MNDLIPQEIKEGTFFGNGLNGWYEEDEDASLVESFFGIYRYSK